MQILQAWGECTVFLMCWQRQGRSLKDPFELALAHDAVLD
jgi:hypothetical protein